MNTLPLEFKSQAFASGDFTLPWSIISGNNEAPCAIPSQFGGSGGGFSPEDLFLQAAINCFMGTFKVIARGSQVQFNEVAVQGCLTVDKNSDGKTMMKTIHLEIFVRQPNRPDRVETLVAKTMREGFILNSLKSDISYQLHIE